MLLERHLVVSDGPDYSLFTTQRYMLFGKTKQTSEMLFLTVKCGGAIDSVYLKCSGNICEVGNASTNDQNLSCKKKWPGVNNQMDLFSISRCKGEQPTLVVFLSGHEGQDGLGVVVGLLLTRRSGILPVIGQFVDPAQVADRVAMGGVFSVSN